jgi:(S)-ureidoglycine aminohydrolase
MYPLGQTRSSVRRDHALIGPDSHVEAPLPGWTGSQGTVLISPAMGARFSQFLARMDEGGSAGPPLAGVERFVYVLSGAVHLEAEGEDVRLTAGGYVFVPPGLPHRMHALEPTRLNLFERRYTQVPRIDVPTLVIGHEQDVVGEPFLGDPDARLKTLLPDSPAYDMAVNLFTYQPGAALPFVEVHIMEHGLLMVAGQGIYRLGDQWYPVAEGDAIWMAPYCPQWFAAYGKEPAAYLYYKDVHRDPLQARP